ncbi:hypothetical protein ABPG77_002455 [Micractinium sp. CCAP 211/92]
MPAGCALFLWSCSLDTTSAVKLFQLPGMSVGEALLAAVKPRLIALPATLVCLCCLAGVCAVSCNDTGCSTADSSLASDGRLRFSSDGTFRILQMTDLHYGESKAQDERSDAFQQAVLSAEKPDLVIFSGDLVSGWVCRGGQGGSACGPGWWEARWAQLTAPVRAAAVPWAITLGNHDAEAELTRRQIVDLAVRTQGVYGLTRQGPAAASGASNYWLDIHPAAGGGADAPAARVWLLDSGDRYCPPLMYGWGCVAEDTLSWVNTTASRMPAAPSIAFVHIPIPQFIDVWWDEPTVGNKQEDVACSVRDTGLFQLSRALGIGAIYSGHDHDNDYLGVMQGVRLAYGRKSGYGGYGPPQGWQRGARVVQLRPGEDTSRSETWIRMEDGSKVYQQKSDEPKGARQMVCVADEFRGDPQLLLRAIELQQQEKGQQNAAETRMLQLAALELGANLGPTKE